MCIVSQTRSADAAGVSSGIESSRDRSFVVLAGAERLVTRWFMISRADNLVSNCIRN